MIKKIDQNTPIDFVFSYVNFEDKEYQNNLYHYVPSDLLKINSMFIDRYKDYGEIYAAIYSIKKFLKFIRYIFVVTPTPNKIRTFYKDDNQIKIIEDKDIIKEGYIKTPNFKSTAIESFLHRIPELAPLFFYGCDDMFIGRNIERDFFFKNGKPLVQLETKSKMVDNIKYYKSPAFIDVYNANKYFREKFGNFPKKWHNHQICLIRKDVCEITWKLYKKELKLNGQDRFRFPPENGVHFILLQHLVGFELKLYDKFKRENLICTGYYDYNKEDGGERFRKIVEMRPHFFCVNALSKDNAKEFFELVQTLYF